MISGRTLGQGAACESKMSPEFFKAVSICFISEEDNKALALSKEKNLLITTAFGQVVLSMRIDPGLPPGMLFIPMGPWANALVGKDTGGCGTPQFKGLEAEVKATDLPVLDIRDLFSGLGRAKA